jgi:AraC-like DNA-binding protein
MGQFMAWLSSDTIFDPDRLGLSVIGIAAELGRHDSGEHQHTMGQLLFAERGCMSITLQKRFCILPPTRAAWIPPHTSHRVEMAGVVGYRSIYLDVTRIKTLPENVDVLETNPLLRAALDRIATAKFDTDWQEGPMANILVVCIDEIRLARRQPTILKLPFDRCLANFPSNELPPSLKELATGIGASEKTISRIFQRETGLNYQQWRQQWRLLKAIELLTKRDSLSAVASDLGFASDSAFVAFFRKMTSLPPRVYMSASGAE